MAQEFVYYKLKGRDAMMVEMLEDQEKAREDARQNLIKKYDAEDVMFQYRGKEKGFFVRFFFGKEEVSPYAEDNMHPFFPPPGWKVQEPSNGQNWAWPEEDCQDYDDVISEIGFLKHFHNTNTVEKIFGYEAVPMRETPSGKYCGSFVREKFMLDDSNPKQGKIRCPNTHIFGSSGTGKTANPVSHMKMDGEWYIRVPCNDKGQPYMVPPESDEVAFDEMMKIDAAEHERRRNPQANIKKGPRP